MMAEAKSNLPERGNGADIYLRFAEPLSVAGASETNTAI